MLASGVVGACGPGARDDDGGGNGADSGPGQAPDAGLPPIGNSVVFAHSADVLFRVDPDTFVVSEVGPFIWPAGTVDDMTDIAIDKNGRITGVSFTRVYRVDPLTVECTKLADLQGGHQFNGLSWIPVGGVDANEETLVGTTLDGTLWRVDPQTGATTSIGDYGGNWKSSGDLVSVEGLGTFATINTGGTLLNDKLAKVDFAAGGTVTVVGTDTGVKSIWGVGFWKGKIFGFTSDNKFVLIDPLTGVATPQSTSAVSWWGAGVTTEAPVIP
jgi:hypothetical protein